VACEKRGWSLRGSILTGVTASLPPPSNHQPSWRAVAHHLIRLHDLSVVPSARSPLMGRATHLSDCINITPTTVPTMYMAQAERLNWVLVELNMKYSPRSAIPKLPAAASFAT
jgi:hypothetical protein